MPTIFKNLIARRLAAFPTEREAVTYAHQKLAEGLQLVNVVPASGTYRVTSPVRFFI